MSPPDDYYQVLNVPPEAGRFQIKRAYRSLALQWYPERVPADKREEAEKVFKKIVEAYFVLENKESRKMYDQHRAAQDSVYQSNSWNFIEPVRSAYDPGSFNNYYREQRTDNDAFKLDGREVFGGAAPKILAGIFFVIIFSFGHETISFLSIDFGVARLSLPVLAATLYIIFESFRDFLWDYVGEDEIYDVVILLICWMILIGFTLFSFSKAWTPLVVEPTAVKVEAVKESANVYDKFPVNMERFNTPINPYATNSIRGKGEI